MQGFRLLLLAAAFASASVLFAQTANQVQLKIDPSSRTISVSAEERVTSEPDIAVLHIGFVTPPSDAKQAYAAGSRASNQVINALKQAGIADSAIRSESQQLETWDLKAHKYQLHQSWAVRVSPVWVAEILDTAVNAGATESGEIEWNVQDEHALEDKALEKAASRARADAQVIAKTMDLQLGKIVYATNQVSSGALPISYGVANFAGFANDRARTAAPLAIEPHKVSRTATIYAVFAIE